MKFKLGKSSFFEVPYNSETSEDSKMKALLLNWSSFYRSVSDFHKLELEHNFFLAVCGLAVSFHDTTTLNEAKSCKVKSFEWEKELIAICSGKSTLHNAQITNHPLISQLDSTDLLILDRLFHRHITLVNFNEYTKRLHQEIFCSYVIAFVQECDPDILLFPEVPHSYGDYFFIAVCRFLGISMYSIKPTGLLDELSPIVEWGSQNILALSGIKQPFKAARAKAINSMITNLSSKKEPYLGKIQQMFIDDRIKSRFESRTLVRNHDNNFICEIAAHKQFIIYNEFHLLDGEKVIIYCLQVDPEATTCPEGHSWFDQLLFISSLAGFCVRHNIRLAIREHPDMMRFPVSGYEAGRHFYEDNSSKPRSLSYYRTVLSIEGVVGFANKNSLDSYVELDEVIAVSTITGTIAIQALFKRLPVIMPQNVPCWYSRLPNALILSQKSTLNDISNIEGMLNVNSFVPEEAVRSTAEQYLIYSRSIQRSNVNDSAEEDLSHFLSFLSTFITLIQKNRNELLTSEPLLDWQRSALESMKPLGGSIND